MPTPQNGQTHSELLECVWPFCEIGAGRVKTDLTFEHQLHKMVKHTLTICRQIADELFECVWPLCGIDA